MTRIVRRKETQLILEEVAERDVCNIVKKCRQTDDVSGYLGLIFGRSEGS